MKGMIEELYHYPIKGLSAQFLDSVDVKPGERFPFDRMFGFARHGSGFDPDDPKPLPKDRFLMLMRDERLAGLKSVFDPSTWRLKVFVAGDVVLDAILSDPNGAAEAEAFFARMFNMAAGEGPTFAHAAPHRFTDVSVVSPALMNAVSLINLASVRDLADRIDQPVQPGRFRANIYFDGWPPFSEMDLVGQQVRRGEAVGKVTLRTRRCAATEVNPTTAQRDIPVPRMLYREYGHSDMGVYLEVETGGLIAAGDTIALETA